MKPLSIQTRLVLLLNLLVIAVLSLTGYISYQQSLHEIDEVFDAQLAQSARLTAGVVMANPTLLQQDKPVLIPVAHLDELVSINGRLLASGAPIDAMNTLRSSASEIARRTRASCICGAW